MTSLRTFEGADIDDLLARVRTEMGSDARIMSAEKVRSGGVAGFFARERFEVVVADEAAGEVDGEIDGGDGAPAEGDAEPDDDGRRSVLGGSARPPEPARSVLDLAEAANRAEAAGTEILTDVAPETAADVARAPGRPPVSTETAAFADVLANLAPEATAADHTPARNGSAVDATLVGLGLPPELAAPVAGTVRRRALVERFRSLPVPPATPVGSGTVLAVAGPLAVAQRVARDLAVEVGIDQSDVVLATPGIRPDGVPPWLSIDTDVAARERRRSWWRRDHPTVVALDADLLDADLEPALAMLRALEPSLTCGCVDAARKPEDVARWAERLGGIDAIVLENLAATVSPAAVLRLGIPVASIDGRPATPASWAALVDERLDGRTA